MNDLPVQAASKAQLTCGMRTCSYFLNASGVGPSSPIALQTPDASSLAALCLNASLHHLQLWRGLRNCPAGNHPKRLKPQGTSEPCNPGWAMSQATTGMLESPR